ncbi:hypothetical protein GGF38_004667, partial [Coemansia sp. RSA 25]
MQFAKTLAISALVAAVAAQEIGEGVAITKSDTKTETSPTSKTSSNTDNGGKVDVPKPLASDVYSGAVRVAGSLAAVAAAVAVS